MRKFKYVLLLAASVVLYFGCSKSNQVAGPAGATGAEGVQGGNLIPIELGPAQLLPGKFVKSTTANYFYYPIRLYNYNKNLTYMITGYVTKQDTGHYNVWNKLPYVGLFGADEMYCSIGNDSIYIWYYNSSNTPPSSAFGADTIPTYKIVIIPSNQ